MVYLEEMESSFAFADGVTPDNLGKIFIEATGVKGWCQPVAFFSCMLDAEFFGGSFGPRHMVDLGLHIGSTLLIFLFFGMATKAVWPSAVVAGLFAVHPINIASVAWTAHHDTGLTLFFLSSSLAAYFYYAKSPSAIKYLVFFVCFVLAIFSHPRILTFPLLLILLDFWPLSRRRRNIYTRQMSGITRMPPSFRATLHIKEKIPLFCVSFLVVGLAWVGGLHRFSLGGASLFSKLLTTIPAALASYGAYLWRIFLLPGVESNRYMMPYHVSFWQIVASLSALIAISVGVFRLAKKGHGYVVTGWLWFLIAMAPGVMVNAAKHELIADRYAYLGAIGIFIIFAWGIPRAVGAVALRGSLKKISATAIGVLVLVVLMCSARLQAQYWRDDLSLVQHTLAIVPAERIFHEGVGSVFLEHNAIEEAIHHFSMALQATPDSAALHANLGAVFIKIHRPEKAIQYLERAILLDPENAEAHHNMGNALLDVGDCDGAIPHFQQALRFSPSSYQTYNSLATAFLCKGDAAKAIACLKKALSIYPAYDAARNNLGRIVSGY